MCLGASSPRNPQWDAAGIGALQPRVTTRQGAHKWMGWPCCWSSLVGGRLEWPPSRSSGGLVLQCGPRWLESGPCKLDADLTQPARKACRAGAPQFCRTECFLALALKPREGASSGRANWDPRSTLSLSQGPDFPTRRLG